ncbi:unnamed protein product, partial [Rotaria magnacalcarata]
RIFRTLRLRFCKFGNEEIALSDILDTASATIVCIVKLLCLAASLIRVRDAATCPIELFDS